MKIKLIKMLFLTVTVLGIGMSLQGAMYMNDVICSFNGDITVKAELESKMIRGASLFLQSQVAAFQLLNEIELSTDSSLNLTVLKDRAKQAIALLENSKSQFTEVYGLAKQLGYNEVKRELFTTFDYPKFIITHSLNKEIATKVYGYLENFDVLGAHNKNIENINNTLTIFYEIRDTQDQGLKPGNNKYWELLQAYSETLLFGNYTTMMGTEILNNCPR